MKRKYMLKKDRAIRLSMNDKYSPYAQRIIIAAGINGTTVFEEMKNIQYGRINFIQKYMKHTKLAADLNDMSEAEKSSSSSSSSSNSSSSSIEVIPNN